MNTLTIKYTSSVLVAAGWRSIEITAKAEKTSPKMLRIIEVIDVDGEGASGYASRTGSKRQRYDVGYIARREEDVKKRLSSVCVVVEE